MKKCLCGCNQIIISKTAKYIRGHNNKQRIGKTIEELYGVEKANKIKKNIRLKPKRKKYKNKVQLEKLKKYREINKDRLYQYAHNWRIKNKEHNKIYKNWKRQNDIYFKLIENLRARIGRAIRYNKTKKSKNTIKLIGCNLIILKNHLEKQFKPGMTWNNYGKWHIDHIIPCSKFDLTKKEEQKKCFHYTNLQPLWAIDNFRKGNKIILNKSEN